MVAFIDQHRDIYGVEPICAVLPIAPSTYFLRKAQQQDPDSGRRARVGTTTFAPRFNACGTRTSKSYGPRKVWKQLRREGVRVARCTVERLMREHGPARGRPRRAWVITTHADRRGERPLIA